MKSSNRYLLFLITSLLVVVLIWWITKQHYNQQAINDSAFTALASTINKVNLQLLKDNNYEYEGMKNRVNKIEFREVVNIWKPKLDSTVWIAIYIHDFFKRFRHDMFLHPHDPQLNEKDFKNLSDSLIQFKNELSHILPKSKLEGLRPLPIEAEPVNISRSHFYKNLSDSGRMAVLSKIEYSALQSVNNVVHLLNDQIAAEPVVYDQFDVLIGQNSTYLLPGQTLQVSAGLGTYSVAAKPFVTMNGQHIPINENGVAIYKRVVSAKDSSGKINVSVSFKDPKTGLTKIKVMMIGYTVFQPSKN